MDSLLQQFVATGSPDVFGEVVSRHAPAVRAHAGARLRDSHAADDVTQAVFIMLSKKAKTLPPQTVLSGWLHGATRLACLAYLRAARRRSSHEQQAAGLRPETSGSGLTSLETREIVNEALTRLSRSDRDVLLLKYQEDLSVTEVATRLGLSVDAVKKRIARASDRLKLVAERLGMASVAPGIDWVAGPLAPPASDPVLAQSVMNSVFAPSPASVGAVEIANGATSMVRRKILITASLSSLTLAAVAGGAMYMFPAAAEPVAKPGAQYAMVETRVNTPPPPTAQTRPAPQRFYTPADTFKRLADTIKAGNEKEAIDCFIVSGDPEEEAIISLVRMSAAEARVEAAWNEVFPGTQHPASMGQRMDQVLAPMVPVFIMMGPRMAPASGDSIELKLRDANLPLPANSPANDWLDVGIKFVKGADGQWRFNLDGLMVLTVEHWKTPVGQGPSPEEMRKLNKRLFADLISATDSFVKDLKDGQFTDAELAREEYDQRIITAMKASEVRSYDFAMAPR